MYTPGTGDCFSLSFLDKENNSFNMVIDAGSWKTSKAKLKPYAEALMESIEGRADLLVVTHEHMDHVLIFDYCQEIFKELEVNKAWMAWSEDDNDAKVVEWKEEHGQKKMALSNSISLLKKKMSAAPFRKGLEHYGAKSEYKQGLNSFVSGLDDMLELNLGPNMSVYKGGMKGMEIVKNEMAKDCLEIVRRGDILEVPELTNVKFYVLGPPEVYDLVKLEHGKTGDGQTYDSNSEILKSQSFSMAVSSMSNGASDIPFSSEFVTNYKKQKSDYKKTENSWRRIDHDWLMAGAGNLALRLNTGLNNLSLVLAIEFTDTGQVMLFPGDAELGSWLSWHEIDWEKKGLPKDLTTDLLSRTEFYKIAHHCSNNGTAKEMGLELMTAKNLVAMGTLDYNLLGSGWDSTMPNMPLMEEILHKTKGKLIMMNEEGLLSDRKKNIKLSDSIKKANKRMTLSERKEFKNAVDIQDHYKSYLFQVNEPNDPGNGA